MGRHRRGERFSEGARRTKLEKATIEPLLGGCRPIGADAHRGVVGRAQHLRQGSPRSHRMVHLACAVMLRQKTGHHGGEGRSGSRNGHHRGIEAHAPIRQAVERWGPGPRPAIGAHPIRPQGVDGHEDQVLRGRRGVCPGSFVGSFRRFRGEPPAGRHERYGQQRSNNPDDPTHLILRSRLAASPGPALRSHRFLGAVTRFQSAPTATSSRQPRSRFPPFEANVRRTREAPVGSSKSKW